MSREQMVQALWIPGWYELDQTLVVGDCGLFYFFADPRQCRPVPSTSVQYVFWNTLEGEDDAIVEAEARVVDINHSQFGAIRAILTEGLDYTVVTADGSAYKIEAEENPGFVYSWSAPLTDLLFKVTLASVRPTGQLRYRMLSRRELKRVHNAEQERRRVLVLELSTPD